MTSARRIPPALQKGDCIGIVAPARRVARARLDELAAPVAAAGYRVKIVDGALNSHCQWAGTDEERAATLHAAFADPQIKAIICARGGYGSYRILPHLDFDLIAANPKIFIGYSDITALLLAIEKRTGLVCFHGPMLVSFAGQDMADANLATLLMSISAATAQEYDMAADGASVLQHGVAEGRLVGGNLELISRLMGTPDAPDFDHAILFIEDIDEELYRLDRALNQLFRAGKLDKIRGLIAGEFVDIHDTVGEGGFGMDAGQVIAQYVPDTHVPVVLNAPCGHGARLLTFPVGIQAKLEAGDNAARLSFSAPVK